MPLHRRVFFIAGFDPKSPRYYHHLFRALAAQRPASAGAGDTAASPVSVGPRQAQDEVADEWDLRWAEPGGGDLHTRVTQLRWDDIVRAHWTRSAAGVLRDHWRFYVGSLRHGLLGVAWRESRLNWLFLMYPLCVALLVALGWLALAFGVGAWLPLGHPAWGVAVAALAGAPPAWWVFRRLSHRLGSDWLMRLYGFSYQQAAGRVPALHARAHAMGERIAAAVRESPEAAEVLVIGHSTGAMLAASALAHALAREPGLGGSGGPALGLLTLGHCTPLVYRFAHAETARAELDALTAHATLAWVDYTAPADWAGCGRMLPWHRRGAAFVRRLSPRFPKLLTPARYAALRRDRLAMHMQYLKPADHAGRYDLLAIAAGRLTLRTRHQDQADDYGCPDLP